MPDARFEAIGLAAFLPLSVLTIDGAPLGSRESFGYSHPRAGSTQIWTEAAEFLPDLVVVDEAFRSETRKVIRAAKAAENGMRSIQILQFNSEIRSEGLDRAALIFCARNVECRHHLLPRYFSNTECGRRGTLDRQE